MLTPLHDEADDDARIAQMIVRIDIFRDALREAIEMTVNRDTMFADEARKGLDRIAGSLGEVPDVLMYNLAAINAATRGVLMTVIRIKLLAVGGGPSLDFPDATSFLNELQPLIDMALRRQVN